jgi:hypothetical protein
VSTASNHFSVGVRALRIGNLKGTSKVHDDAEFSQTMAKLARSKKGRKMKPRPVNYAWVNGSDGGKGRRSARRGRFDSHTYFALVVYSKMAWLCVSYVRIDIHAQEKGRAPELNFPCE